jgi:pyruvate formate-lyase activating enzyme-like uncharacterized protein
MSRLNPKKRIEKTKFYSWKIGEMAKGCQQCVKGEKSVFFITGLCSNHCFYCPISDIKKNKDVVYINEWPTKEKKDIIKEIRLCKSKGVGITGGDPLAVEKRAVEWIKDLKKEFGKGFHIHLYTPLNIVDEKKLARLFKAGLDEIRFHPSLEAKKKWQRLEKALKYKWDVGVEIPAMPGYEKMTKELIDYIDMLNHKMVKDKSIKGKIKFTNINELEIADNKFNELADRGYKTKDRLSYAVKGSQEMAIKLMDYIIRKGYKINVHYCTATLKDKVQMAKRIRKRAESIALPGDRITEQGTLIRGAIYLSGIKPDYGYRKKLVRINKNKKRKKSVLKKLAVIKNGICKDFRISKKKINLDENKLRLLTSPENAEKIKDAINESLLKNALKDKKLLGKKDLFLAIVEEYPTYDGFEVEVEYL